MEKEIVQMSEEELEKLKVINEVIEGKLEQKQAA